MQRIRNRGNKGDGPPLFSYEFIIQNHADIVSCICMVIFMLLIPQVCRYVSSPHVVFSSRLPFLQATNSFASGLIFIHNNVTVPVEGKDAAGMYYMTEGSVLYNSPYLEKSSVRLDKQKAMEKTMYYHGTEDVYNVAFYCLVWIIIHALLQEYIWEVW